MLLEYEFDLLHKPSARVSHVDRLSRKTNDNRKLEEDRVVTSVSRETEIKIVFSYTVKILPGTAVVVRWETASDSLLKIKEAILKDWEDNVDREYHQLF